MQDISPNANTGDGDVMPDASSMVDYAKGGKTDGLIAYHIPQYYAYALTNADSSGLTDEDEEILNEFVDIVKDNYGNAFFMTRGDESFEPRFEPSNDVTYNQGSDVVTLYIQPSKDYAKGGWHRDRKFASKEEHEKDYAPKRKKPFKRYKGRK